MEVLLTAGFAEEGPGVWEPDPYAGHPLNIWSNLPAAILAKCRPGIHQTRLFVLRTGWASMGAYWMSIGRFQMPIWRRGVLIAPPKPCHGFLNYRYLLALP